MKLEDKDELLMSVNSIKYWTLSCFYKDFFHPKSKNMIIYSIVITFVGFR